MARIYQAEHAGLRRQVALKVLLDGQPAPPRGAHASSGGPQSRRHQDPNVVNIFDVGRARGYGVLGSMELLAGTDLEKAARVAGRAG